MRIIYSSRFLFFSALIVFFSLLQICGGVYNSTNLSVERALEIDQPVKIKTTKGTVYKIKELEKDDNGIFGVTREESNAARKHKAQITERNYKGKFVKISIPEDSIKEIRTKNKALSVLLPIAIGVTIIATFGYILSNMAFMPM